MTLNTNQKIGLSNVEAKKRLAKYGENTIQEQKTSNLVKLLSFFWGPIPWMIKVAVILSGILQRWEDFFIICLMLLLNAGVGFWQQHKADNAIADLKEKLALNARVLREGKWMTISASGLVPGDIVLIKLGNIIPADIKYSQVNTLQWINRHSLENLCQLKKRLERTFIQDPSFDLVKW